MNSAVVSQISERAGARQSRPGSKALPNNYKPVARKVTLAIVALPIAIVTSYVLWQRREYCKGGLTSEGQVLMCFQWFLEKRRGH
jgi:hypothetical protein